MKKMLIIYNISLVVFRASVVIDSFELSKPYNHGNQ